MNVPCRVPLQSDSGAVHASLPDKTALFVANYLHQLRVIHGMDMTLDQAIGICGGQLDIPGGYFHFPFLYVNTLTPYLVADQNPMHDQYFADTDVPSTSHADSQFSKSDTHEVTLSGKVPFISNAVMKTSRPLIKHEIFRDGSRAKVRCLEGRCNGRELMKENYARHVRELHLGEKRRAGGHIRRGVRLKFGWLS